MRDRAPPSTMPLAARQTRCRARRGPSGATLPPALRLLPCRRASPPCPRRPARPRPDRLPWSPARDGRDDGRLRPDGDVGGGAHVADADVGKAVDPGGGHAGVGDLGEGEAAVGGGRRGGAPAHDGVGLAGGVADCVGGARSGADAERDTVQIRALVSLARPVPGVHPSVSDRLGNRCQCRRCHRRPAVAMKTPRSYPRGCAERSVVPPPSREPFAAPLGPGGCRAPPARYAVPVHRGGRGVTAVHLSLSFGALPVDAAAPTERRADPRSGVAPRRIPRSLTHRPARA
jgi:hypothetical protein